MRPAPAHARSVIISNGHFKFRMATLAAELDQRGWLELMITGAYPTTLWATLAGAPIFRQIGGLGRLHARAEPGLAVEKVVPQWTSEVVIHALRLLARLGRLRPGRWDHLATSVYTSTAVRAFSGSQAKIFHFRAGYGQGCISIAKSKGMILIADSPLLFPERIEDYVAEREPDFVTNQQRMVRPLFRQIADDARRADHLVVNSDFSKETFVQAGWVPERVHVQYTGVDDNFARAIEPRERPETKGPLRLIFAGDFGRRKGAHHLIVALERLSGVEWSMELVGGVDRPMRRDYPHFFADARVKVRGNVSRTALAGYLSRAEVLIFPSLAEGSARVVFEALACGCYVITTPNTGSIVGRHAEGSVVAAGDVAAIVEAIRFAAARRDSLGAIGERNRRVVRERFTQRDYADGIVGLYERLLAGKSEKRKAESEKRKW